MKNSELNFNGQIIYVGIDVHKKSWQITIILNGMIVKKISINPNPEELSNYLKRNYPNAIYYSVYEAGFSGFWADRQLRSMGIINIVVNPADVPTKSKERRTKTDRIDSTKLARELSVNHLEGIYIPSEKAEALRTLVRLRRQLVTNQTREKNRIKSLLLFLGYKVDDNIQTKHWSQNYIKALINLDIKHLEAKTTLNELLTHLNFIRTQLAKILKQIKQFIEKDEESRQIIKILQSVPGIGFILAIILYSEIIDIGRFKKFDELVRYVGLSPAIYSSSEKEINLGLSKQKNKYIRNFLIEASWAAIKKDPALQMAYGNLCKKMPPAKAIIRISKKLLSRIRYVWSNRQEYVIAVTK
jgi:transposase